MTNRLRRAFSGALLAFLAACSVGAQAAEALMYKDPNCGCCDSWAAHVRDNSEHTVTVSQTTEMTAIKDRYGVPADLRSCHTMIVDGYVIEGHVPAADIDRLLAERPEGVRGLAVPGMPLGSPGMEVGGRVQPYQVIAFGEAGRSVFASYN